MSEFVGNLAETAYSDEAFFAVEALETVLVDASLVSGSEIPGDFNSVV